MELSKDCTEGVIANFVLGLSLLAQSRSEVSGRRKISWFRAVCKRWAFLPPTLPSNMHDHNCLMSLDEESGSVEFFNPLRNSVTHTNVIPELRGSHVQCYSYGWLLMSNHYFNMFFFNPISNAIIKLPNLVEKEEEKFLYTSFYVWTFSCSPADSSKDCFVVGIHCFDTPPLICIIKVGESTWTYHDLYDETKYYPPGFWSVATPTFVNENTICVVGDEGNLGILSIMNPSWEFHGKQFPRRKRESIRQIFMAKDVDSTTALLAVFITHEEGRVEVWRYKIINGSMLERKRITSLGNKTLFVSNGASYLKPCIAQSLGNKIFFPMFHQNKGVFYCLATSTYYSFDYSSNHTFSAPNFYNLDQPRSSIWIPTM